MGIPRRRLRISRTRTTAISVLIALLGSVSLLVASPRQARADVAAPSWWDGTTCDTAHYPGSYALGASYNGVQACGPGPDQGGTDHEVNFGVGTSQFEWECVELSMRYMYLVYGISPYYLTGGDAYNIVADYSGSVLTQETDPSTDGLPTPGDILAFAPNTFGHGSNGHTAVVTGYNYSGGTVTSLEIMEQNDSANGWDTVPVSNGVVGGGVTGWLHYPGSSTTSLFVVLSGGTLYGKANLSDSWTTLAGDVASVQVSGDRIVYTDTAGNVWAKDGLDGDWYEELNQPGQVAFSDSLMAILVGNTLYGRANLTDSLTTLATNAASVQVSGTRIVYTDTSGNIWAMDGLHGTWYQQTNQPGQSVAFSDSLMTILSDGTLYGRTNLTNNLTTLAGDVASAQVSGTRIVYTDTGGNVWAKDTLTGTWYEQLNQPGQVAFSDELMTILVGGTLYGRANLTDNLTTLAGDVASAQVSGDWIAYTDTGGNVWAKDGLDGTWYEEFGPVQEYAFSGP